MHEIFLSYTREDAAETTPAISNDLTTHPG